MHNETLKAKLTWQCRRGMLELDLILNAFIAAQLDRLTDEELRIFSRVLNTPDPQLYEWLMGRDIAEDKEICTFVNAIIANTYPR